MTVVDGTPMEIGARWRGASMVHDDGLIRGAAFRERGAALRVLIKEEDLTP
jgi:hypothetical protein